MRDGLPVHFFAMSHFYDEDNPIIIIHGVNHSIVALANAVFLVGGKFLASLGARVGGQPASFVHNFRPIFAGEFFDFLYRRTA